MGRLGIQILFEDGETQTQYLQSNDDRIKAIVHFRQLENYNGEFGFDWMRDNYQMISENYEELKKYYKDAQINSSEYFVPYLSMFPGQDNILLNLDILLGNKVTKNDVIKLPF